MDRQQTTCNGEGRCCGPRMCWAQVLAGALLLAAAACGGAPNPPVAETGRGGAILPAATLASPEARYCLSKGGQVQAEPGPQGVRALCALPDHRLAEIGALYRAEVSDPL